MDNNPGRLPLDQNRRNVVGGVSTADGSTILSGEINSSDKGLLVHITNGGSGGTSSTFGQTFPTTGTAVGASDGTNMQPLLVDGSGYLEVNVKSGGGGGTQYAELNTTSPATGTVALGRYVSSLPTLTTGELNAPMLDSSARLMLGTSTATIGALQMGSTDYFPGYNVTDLGGLPLQTNPYGSLSVEAAVTTDEGAHKSGFTGSNPYWSFPNNITFTNGSTTITTSSGFSSNDMHYLDWIRLSSDAESAWAQISFINSDTEITLAVPYTGTGGTGTGYVSGVATSTGSGGTISVASGALTIASGTTNASQTMIYNAVTDGSQLYQAHLSISQRIANQDIYMGLEASPLSTIKAFARFHWTGTDNTKVLCETAWNPTTTPSSSEIDTTTVTLPNSLVTSSTIRYRIDAENEQIIFSVNDIVVATARSRIPHVYAFGNNGYQADIRILNGTSPAGSTNVVVNDTFTKDFNRIDVNQTSIGTQFNTQTVGGIYQSAGISAVSGQMTPLQLNSSGYLNVAPQGNAASGAAVSGYPILVGGSDGTDARTIATDTSGHIQVVPSSSTSAAVPSLAQPMGVQAVSANPTATTTTYNTIPIANLTGKLVALPYGIQETFQSGTASATGTTSTSLIGVVSSNKIYLTACQVMNTGATTVYVALQDGSAGTTKAVIGAPAGGGSNVTFPVPIANTLGNAWYFAASGSSSTVYVSAQGYSEIT